MGFIDNSDRDSPVCPSGSGDAPRKRREAVGHELVTKSARDAADGLEMSVGIRMSDRGDDAFATERFRCASLTWEKGTAPSFSHHCRLFLLPIPGTTRIFRFQDIFSLVARTGEKYEECSIVSD
jgi:hypothetical protein